MGEQARAPGRALLDGYTAAVVAGRWWVLLAVAAGTLAAVQFLPGLTTVGGGLAGLLGSDQPAVNAQAAAAERFGLPLLSPTAVVQRDPGGLDPYLVADTVLQAVEVIEETVRPGGEPPGPLRLAYPVINTPLLFPGAAEQNTTIVTYLFIDPAVGLPGQAAITQQYAETLRTPEGGLVGPAGTFLAQATRNELIANSLPLVELATVAAIALIVGLHFRSVVAPLVTLVTAGIGYLLTDRAIGLFGAVTELVVPNEMQPVVVALLLGITTDYTIFFVAGLRSRLRDGLTGWRAVRSGVALYLPIVVVAGLTVAAGVSGLLVAESPLFRAFGPGLAITVLVGLTVSVTLVPALLAILGRRVFWPSQQVAAGVTGRPARTVVRGRLLRLLRRRGAAAAVTVAITALLVLATVPLTQLRGSVAPVDGLPPDSPVRVATEAAAAGFAPGILGPTEVIVSAPGVAANREALARLDTALDRQPGVAGVLGPGDQPPALDLGLFVAPDGGAARFLVILDADPLGATAINTLAVLRDRMPVLLDNAGLGRAEVAFAGDSAVGLPLVETAIDDLGRVAVAVLLIDLVLLIIFLRALIAPLYLLASSVLAVGAALGLTVAVFQGLLDQDGLIFYVPFAAAVLLVALGSDYNILSVGDIWDEASRRPLREALAVAVPRATGAINAAGAALAVSFGFVALIPVAMFGQMAFVLAIGVLIDAFVVRSLLVPSLISLFGRVSGWPGRRLTMDHPIPAVASPGRPTPARGPGPDLRAVAAGRPGAASFRSRAGRPTASTAGWLLAGTATTAGVLLLMRAIRRRHR